MIGVWMWEAVEFIFDLIEWYLRRRQWYVEIICI